MILLLLACAHSSSHCSMYVQDVADDETDLDGLPSPATLLEEIVGTWVVPATEADGQVTTVEVTVERGEGSAVFTDAETVSGPPSLWPFHQDYGMNVPCDDLLEFPVVVTLDSVDGAFALAGAGTAEAGGFQGETNVAVVHPIDPTTETLPGTVDASASLSLGFSEGRLSSLEINGTDLILTY